MVEVLGQRIGVALCATVAALALAACGSSSSSTSSTAGSAAAVTPSSSNNAGRAEAMQILKPFTGRPSPFPVDHPLKRIPTGTTVVTVNCGTPFCGLISQQIAAAGKTAGVKVQPINSGTSASSINSAFDTIVTTKPGAVIVPALDPQIWSQAIPKLKAAGIPIISVGITNGAQFGLSTYPNVVTTGPNDFMEIARLEAAYVAAHYGANTQVAYISVPELSFSKFMTDVFTTTLRGLCPNCKVNVLNVPAASIGSTAPSQIVSFLQSQPNVKVLSGSVGEALQGLPSALKAAGLNVDIVGSSPTPENLVDLKAGRAKAYVGIDVAVGAWSAFDAAMRAITKQPFTKLQTAGEPPVQVLEPKDITFDPTHGWTGYPDFASRFAKLWGK